MSTPRDSLVNPKAFGKGGAEWVAVRTPSQAARMRAARLQHAVSIEVRKHLRARKLNYDDFADIVGWRRDRVARMLIGQIWGSVVDLEELAGACGETLVVMELRAISPEERAVAMNGVITAYLKAEIKRLEAGVESLPSRSPLR